MADITIIDHGKWEIYKPDPVPEWAAPLQGLATVPVFCRRESDGKDYYELRKAGLYQPNSVVCTVLADADGTEVVKAVFRDTSMLFPFNQRIIEIIGFDPDDHKPHNEFAWKVYDPETKTLSDPKPTPVLSVKDYQFAGQAYAEGIIDFEAAKGWTGAGVVPKNLLEVVEQFLADDPERRDRVILFLMGTKEFPRNHELTPLLAASFGKDTPDKVDAFFEAASKR
jgi:hypothetical protein